MRIALFMLVMLVGFVVHAISPTTAAAKSADCAGTPMGQRSSFRHLRSGMVAQTSQPRHRGTDLIAVEGDENQTLGGKLAYSHADKDLEDEDVEIFACEQGSWRSIATARTDGDGRFSATLVGDARLPVGMTDLYARVPGDGSGVSFVGLVLAKGESVVISDVDGTLTASENAIYRTVFLGDDIAHQPGAPEALRATGKHVIYISSRGDQLTGLTREWLDHHDFPKGPVRHASSMITLPGHRTVALKTDIIAGLHVPIDMAIGNRASDIAAYRKAGVAPDRVFINLPEFTHELRDHFADGTARPFDHFRELVDARHSDR